jgi:heptosyltransferase II
VRAVSSERVLVVGPAWVGDMVMAQSLFRSLDVDRSAQVDVLAPAWSAPLLARMPEVAEAIPTPFAHSRLDLGARLSLARNLRRRRYDQAIVLPLSAKSALIPLLARIPRRTGFRGEWRYGLLNDVRPLDSRTLPMTVQRYVALGEPAGAPLPPRILPPALAVDERNQARLLRHFEIERERPIVGFMPGAEYGPAKRWPASRYAALARELVSAGFQICLFGSDRDAAICAEIARESGGVVTDLSGRTTLADAIDLIAATALCVTNDSGLMHVAAATGRPLVAVYGSSAPTYTPPLSERAEIAYLGLPCSPCFQRECPLGHLDCLRGISVADVLRRVERTGVAG